MILGVQQLNDITSNYVGVQKNNVIVGDAAFTDSLEAARKLIQDNLEAEKTTEQLTTDFLTGANDNIHSLLIAQEKSSILLQYTLQLRNGILDAYNEIMQLSI